MTRCPSCREPVSQFAAGCALCGADLEQARRDRAGRRSLPKVAAPRVHQDTLYSGIVVLCVLSLPLLGVLLAGLGLRTQTMSSQRGLRVVLWIAVAVGLLLLVSPVTRYGVWWRLGA